MDRTTIIATVLGFLLICVTSAPTSKEQDIDIYSFHINTTVTSRYAITVITSRVANRFNESKEVHFQVKIPKNAFISKFRMTIEGKTYDGVVKKKEEAQQQYSQAVSRGESAGLVSSVGRTLEEFKTSVTVAAFSKVTFELTYEELLKRRLGKYELLINAQPMQPVADFKIDVYIHESPGISLLEVKGGLNTNELANAVTSTRSGKEVWVNFYPTLEQQTKCEACGPKGMNGDLIIMYDVDRSKPSGELKASNGYFVHYFAPTDIERIPKNVVFVIDRSGSMHGRKIQQTRQALLKILGDLAGEDHFGLIAFDDEIEVWKSELIQATGSNLKTAKEFVRKISDQGATDINAAVLKGAEMINRHPRESSTSILILLTDGDPTSGETAIERIQANVKKAIKGTFPLYCLGFGFDVNFDFLEKMALENNGLARRIYEDSDADLQLQGFFEEVAVPLLTDVQLNYIGAVNLTQTSFSHYYNGSEIVVAGQITDNSLETFQTEVIAISKRDEVTFQDSLSTKDVVDVLPQHDNFIQRLWACLTVKQLLEKEVTLEEEEKEAAKKEALDLSLKYKFVTPLTSMVVTKPHEEDTHVAHKPKEGERPDSVFPHGPPEADLLFAEAEEGMEYDDSFSMTRSMDRSTETTSSILAPEGMEYDDSLPMMIRIMDSSTKTTPTTPAPVGSIRFLISSRDQAKPICYDLPVAPKLRLLMDPSSDFSMNGLVSQKGFELIILRFKNSKHMLRLSPVDILYVAPQQTVKFVWGQEITRQEADSVTLILRKNEVDVTMGTVRVVVLHHEKNGEKFLWPAVRQQPSGVTLQGILAKNNLQYEELPGSLIKINEKEMKASWSTAVDYRLPSSPSVGCWLVPFQFALQGELPDFTVSDV
ncbi:inter-alpha-trypsin inhibitor heavy chain H3-like [Colossoma macropomum]|uniref:inter-alpha-trypsin inhibitor heavy chain H3-like n=1 Tax=Colossoma macropomum TaxID=42526 RepID=UPI001863C1DD|nr:inter-alpha-trypsin inhibitor heavy chain H3-like [Colossoma macropomum]